jgi:hypothetical protein
MPAVLKTRKVLVDAVIDPCLCNLMIWTECDGEQTSIHIGPCCPRCERTAREAILVNWPELPITIEYD